MSYRNAFKKRTIPYRPEWRKHVGSMAACILLQQIIYWDEQKNGDKFFKFKEPCEHDWYKEGDSWCEELGCSAEEFDTALKKIGRKVTKKNPLKDSERPLVTYWTESSRVTWYKLHREALEETLLGIYHTGISKTGNDTLPKPGMPVYEKRESRFINTETTTKTTTQTEERREERKKESGAFCDELRVYVYEHLGSPNEKAFDAVFPYWLKQQQIYWETDDLSKVSNSVKNYVNDFYTPSLYQYHCKVVALCEAADISVDLEYTPGNCGRLKKLNAVLIESGTTARVFGNWFKDQCEQFKLSRTLSTAISLKTLEEFSALVS